MPHKKTNKVQEQPCEHCGTVFTPNPYRATKFCKVLCWYEWKRARSHNLAPMHTCKQCGITFARRRRDRKPAQFCSPECANKSRRIERKIHFCRKCGVEFTLNRGRGREDGKVPVYCSRTCWRDDLNTPIKHSCKCRACGRRFTSTRFLAPKFCSKQCVAEYQRRYKAKFCKVCGNQLQYANWGMNSFCSVECSDCHAYLIGGLDYRMRGMIFTIQRKGKWCCEKCGNENPDHLTVHHRDQNRQNNADENLETLCGNCHWEIHLTNRPSRDRRLRRANSLVISLAKVLPLHKAKLVLWKPR